MKKLWLIISLIFCFQIPAFSQFGWQWGFGTGNTLYFGDLGNEQYIPLTGMHYGCSFSLRHDLKTRIHPTSANQPFAIVARADWMRIGYDETRPLIFSSKSGTDLRNFRRGLNFRNDLIGLNAQFTWTLYTQKFFPLSQHHFALYFFIGPGLYYSDPHADLFRGTIDYDNRYYYWDDGTLRDAPQSSGTGNIVSHDQHYETRLREWYTEGESDEARPGKQKEYGLFQVGFPHGGGIKYGISRRLLLQWEWCFYDFPFTDYLDDVSNRYATYEEIAENFPDNIEKQALARYITDPSGWGSDGENGKASSPRGNPRKFDWINYMNVQLFFIPESSLKSYKPKRHPRSYNPKF